MKNLIRRKDIVIIQRDLAFHNWNGRSSSAVLCRIKAHSINDFIYECNDFLCIQARVTNWSTGHFSSAEPDYDIWIKVYILVLFYQYVYAWQ